MTEQPIYMMPDSIHSEMLRTMTPPEILQLTALFGLTQVVERMGYDRFPEWVRAKLGTESKFASRAADHDPLPRN
jgi:hypothetical protein